MCHPADFPATPIEQLKKGAESFQRAVRAGDAGAAVVVREFHPRLPDAQPGSPELGRFTRADAQLVVARQFAFASWPKLKAHMGLVERYARSPHEQPIGGPLADDRAIVDEFLRLACLTYGDDDPDRLSRADSLLREHDWLARASVHTIAATGDLDAARELLDSDPVQASLVGGSHRWEPLIYLTYSRVAVGPGRSAVGVARLLLEHGADPNAGYLWEGLVPPFTALTGALGGGGNIQSHPERLALARLLLEAGADANDAQALYNQGWGQDPQEDWLALLFEFGLGTGDAGRWRQLLGERMGSPRAMVEDLLMADAVDEDNYPERLEWLAGLPRQAEEIAADRGLELGDPYLPGGQCAWVAPATHAAGDQLVLKVGWRHREAEHEADALRFWDGDGAVRCLATRSLEDTTALLLDRCVPGVQLKCSCRSPSRTS
ncbi:MAG: aminoglycoside phosphotransferase family protein [Actinomycetota bacterium]|nr:aminoglycoside phosphotransferase family protein [Actinomycetota bacterium]